MVGFQLAKSATCQESLKVIEADVQHANMLAASIPRNKSGEWLQMKIVHNHLAPLILYLLQWIDCSCTCLLPSWLNLFYVVIYKVNSDGRADVQSYGRRATIREFYGVRLPVFVGEADLSNLVANCYLLRADQLYVKKINIEHSWSLCAIPPISLIEGAVILPYLQRLYGNTSELADDAKASTSSDLGVRKFSDKKFTEIDFEREDECGICLEPCTKMVLPNCCHSMCINCYRDWNLRSESCPFCRGSIKRVESADLWVLTCGTDVVDPKTVVKEDILRLYLYINSLPKDVPDALFLMYYEYLI